MANGGPSDDTFIEEEYDPIEDSSNEEKELVEGLHDVSLNDSSKGEDFLLRKLASEVETKYATLESKLKNIFPEPIPINVFYHVTNATAKENIKRDGILKASVSSQPNRRTASPIDKMKIAAVHFRLNLKNEKLPTTSPFGTERVCIPISHFSEYELFFNHYNQGNPKTNGGHEIYYVSLVLVKPSHERYNDIKKVLKREGNEFVYFKHDEETYYYNDYYNLSELQPGEKRRKSFNVYYEIAVIDDILLPAWDDVIHTRRN